MGNTLIIDKSDLDVAKHICSVIEEPEIRSQAVANSFAAKIVKKYFETTDLDIDVESGLHNVPLLLRKFDFSDIYLNEKRVEVRLYFENEPLTVPKFQYDNGLLPYAYMFIKINPENSQVNITGFVLANKINFLEETSEYCKVEENLILNKEEFLPFLNTVLTEPQTIENIEIDMRLFDFIDGKLDEKEIISLMRFLFSNKDARLKLIDITKADAIFSYLSTEPNLSFEQEQTKASSVNLHPEIDEFELEKMLEEDSSNSFENYKNDDNITSQQDLNDANSENPQIEELFINNDIATDETFGSKVANTKNKKKNFNILVIITTLFIISVIGYLAYTQYFSQNLNTIKQNNEFKNDGIAKQEKLPKEQMPIESIENEKKVENIPQNVLSKDIATVSIPTIEQNLGVSISISNLSISWDVPSSYLSNNTVHKYFIKMGKIIQLNLKTELLLLSKQPITNKISLELEFDKKINKFKVKNIINSSGEKSVDDSISKAVNSALLIELKNNMDVFTNLSGNPVLTIRL